MRVTIPFYILAASSLAQAIVFPQDEMLAAFTDDVAVTQEKSRLIQLSPTETQWVTEDQKLELKRVRWGVLYEFSDGR